MANRVAISPRKYIHAIPPFGGLVTSSAFVSQPEGGAFRYATTSLCENFRPMSVNPEDGSDPMQGRYRVGLRPGFRPAYGTRFGRDVRIQGNHARVMLYGPEPYQIVLNYATDNPDWTQYGIQPGDEVVLSDPTGADNAVDIVDSVTADHVVLVGGQAHLSTDINFIIQSNVGGPIRLLNEIVPGAQEQLTFRDDFDDGNNGDYLHGPWRVARWINHTYMPQYDGAGNIYVNDEGNRGGLLITITYDTSKPYVFNFRAIKDGANQRGSYRVFFRLNDSVPDAESDGIAITATMKDGNGDYTAIVDHYVGGVKTTLDTDTGTLSTAADEDFTMNVVVVKNRYITFKILPETATPITVCTALDAGAPTANEGSKLAFGMQSEVADHKVKSDFFEFNYFPVFNSNTLNKKILVTSAEGKLYVQRDPVDRTLWDQVDSPVRLSSDIPLQSASAFGSLYIADYADPKVIGVGTGALASGALTSSEVSDFTPYNIDPDEDLCLIYDASTPSVNKVYKIISVSTGTVNLDGTPTSTTCSFRIQRGAKKYDTATGIFHLWITNAVNGQPPLGCPHICIYRGRLVMGGFPPFAIFFSRINDFDDWDFGDVDNAAAFAATADETFGVGAVRDTITALIPSVNNDFLIVGCEASIWIVRGDPRQGGIIQTLCPTYGMLPGKAWCYGPDGSIFFVSNRGFCMITNTGYPPTNLSENKIPWNLLVPDSYINDYGNTAKAFVEYDKRVNGIHIYISLESDEGGEANRHFFYHLGFQSFWGWQVEAVVTQVAAFNDYWFTDSPVLFGTDPGFICAFRDVFYGDAAEVDDDSYAFRAQLAYGPFYVSQMRESTVLELQISLAYGSVAYHEGNNPGALVRVFSGSSAEAAYNAMIAADPGTYWEATLQELRQQQFLFRPMRRGRYHYVQFYLNSSLSGSWAIEDVTLQLEDSGKGLLVT